MRALGRARAGASLAELLVALALLAVVGGATLRVLDRQARFHAGVMAVMEARAQHAAAHEALAVELRGASTAAGDIARLSDSAIVFRMPVGAGIACAVSSGTLDLAPDSVASGQHFARFRTTPQDGDTAWVFDEGASDVATDDAWRPLALQVVSRGPDRCTGSPLVDAVLDAGAVSWRFATSASLPATVRPGAAVRLTRVARFAHYRGGTGEWWLGFAERQPALGWVTIQPVAGPYLPYRAGQPATGGIALAGRDSSGAATIALAAGLPAALAISTRTLTTRTVRMDGVPRGRKPDSLHSLVGLRNRQ